MIRLGLKGLYAILCDCYRRLHYAFFSSLEKQLVKSGFSRLPAQLLLPQQGDAVAIAEHGLQSFVRLKRLLQPEQTPTHR